MSALYQMTYQGAADQGHGALYVGKGLVLGIDTTGARYGGIYNQPPGQGLTGRVTITSAGGALVTGQQVPAGTEVTIRFALPENFDNGSYHTLFVDGQPVQVAFNKIGDIP